MADPSTTTLLRVIALNGGLGLLAASFAIRSGSHTLVSEALHELGDVLVLAVALVAAQSRHRLADALGGLFSGGVLLASSLWIGLHVWLDTGHSHVEGLPMLLVASVGLWINAQCAWWLWGAEGLSCRAALVHLSADALGSLATLLAAGGVLAGLHEADLWGSLIVASLVAAAAVQLVVAATRQLVAGPQPTARQAGALAGARANASDPSNPQEASAADEAARIAQLSAARRAAAGSRRGPR